jgi:hypothetical protein
MFMYKKKLVYMGLALLCILAMLQKAAAADNPFEDLADNRLTGFFLGGGVGYRIARTEDGSAYSSSARPQWKIGYGTSERHGFYVTSVFPDFAPELGVMWFSEQAFRRSPPRHYLQALIGFYRHRSEADVNILSFAFGVGHEFRSHFIFEVMAGYNQAISQRENPYKLNEITLVVSVNHLLY